MVEVEPRQRWTPVRKQHKRRQTSTSSARVPQIIPPIVNDIPPISSVIHTQRQAVILQVPPTISTAPLDTNPVAHHTSNTQGHV